MPAQQAPDAPRPHAGPVYRLVLALTGLLTIYVLVWCVILLAVIGWDARISVFGADIYNAVQAADDFNLAVIGVIGVLAVASFVLVALRSAWAIATMVAIVSSHLVLWLRLISNPYYSAPIGYIVIPIEFVLIALLLLLVRRGILR